MEIQVNIKETIFKCGVTKEGQEVCRSMLDTGQIIWHTREYILVHPCDISTYPE